MTLTLELKPDEVALLEAQAKAQGVDIETVLHSLIAQSGGTPERPLFETASEEEWEEFMDALAAGGENLPVLSEEAYDR